MQKNGVKRTMTREEILNVAIEKAIKMVKDEIVECLDCRSEDTCFKCKGMRQKKDGTPCCFYNDLLSVLREAHAVVVESKEIPEDRKTEMANAMDHFLFWVVHLSDDEKKEKNIPYSTLLVQKVCGLLDQFGEAKNHEKTEKTILDSMIDLPRSMKDPTEKYKDDEQE